MYSKIGLFLLLLFAAARPVQAAVVINEFQVKPSGASQWVELYNTGAESVDISGWFIDDDGGTEKYTIPSNTVLGSGYCLSFQSGNFHWDASSSDSARLLSGATLVDEYSYSNSPEPNLYFGRSPDGTGSFTKLPSPTRNALNSNGVSCLAPPTPTPTLTPTLSPTATPAPTNTPTPTFLPTATPTKTPTPTKKPTPSPPPSPTTGVEATPTASVLGIEAEPTPEATAAANTAWRPIVITLLFVGLGLALLSTVLVWQKRHAMILKE